MKSDNAKFQLNTNGRLQEIADHGNVDTATFKESLRYAFRET